MLAGESGGQVAVFGHGERHAGGGEDGAVEQRDIAHSSGQSQPSAEP